MSGSCQATIRLAVLVAVGAAIMGCNYGFRGGGGFPAHVQSVYIAPLENETVQFDVDQQIFLALTDRLPRAFGVRLAGERGADAVVRGRVTRYDDAAMNYRPGQTEGTVEVVQHQVQITMNIQIIDVQQNEILYEGTGLSGRGEYRPEAGQSEDVARARAIEALIQQIVDRAQSQW